MDITYTFAFSWVTNAQHGNENHMWLLQPCLLGIPNHRQQLHNPCLPGVPNAELREWVHKSFFLGVPKTMSGDQKCEWRPEPCR